MSRPAAQRHTSRRHEGWTDAGLADVNARLETMTAAGRVDWILANVAGKPLLSSSFGAQAAVMLHLLSRKRPGIPVVFIDTGYLFPETYRFVDTLSARLALNLQVFRPEISAAWLEARHGRLWEQGEDGIRRYNRLVKVEPMERALASLDAGTWFSGLRRAQSESRRDIRVLQSHGTVLKAHPLADWSNRDVHRYLKRHDLPYHPLWEKGYVSIGDHHTSQPLGAGQRAEDTRFFGIVRECGLHEADHFARAAP